MNTPLVSVIMTVYNGERYVAQAIESICQQSLLDFELVIVDDGSTDGTAQILSSLKNKNKIRLISQPRMGRAIALNIAWTHSRGFYIANLDADDYSEPNRLKKQVNFLQQHPEIGLLGTACKFMNQNTGKEWIEKYPPNDAELRKSLVRCDPFVHSSVMIPRHVLEHMNGYNEAYQVAIDYELWVRIASSYRLAILPEQLTVRRVDGSNYFRYRISEWERYKTKVKIRRRAWLSFSRKSEDLPYIFVEPLTKWFKHSKISKIIQTMSPGQL